MTKSTSSNHRLANLGDAYGGPPFEDQFDRARRQADELAQASDEIIARGRRRIDGKAGFARFTTRQKALRELAHIFYGTKFGNERRRAVKANAVYAALPAAAKAAWDELLIATDDLVIGHDGGIAQPAAELARRQAQDLESWDPAEPEADDASGQIPRA